MLSQQLLIYAIDSGKSTHQIQFHCSPAGSIVTNDVTLRPGSRFTGITPTFTLEARTSGGPPTTSTWTRDGVEITSGILLALDTNPQISETFDNEDAYLNSRYISTLVVYQYSASNRAMASPRTDSFNIEGIYIAVVAIYLCPLRFSWRGACYLLCYFFCTMDYVQWRI